MKMLVKNHLKTPIQIFPGDHVTVTHKRGSAERVVADWGVKESGSYNTAFVAELEPGDIGFSRGYVGGIAQEETV